MEKKDTAAPTNELAKRIYVELVARNTVITEGSVKMAGSAENLATLSIRLAEAFDKVQVDVIAARAPVTTFKLQATDIAEWLK